MSPSIQISQEQADALARGEDITISTKAEEWPKIGDKYWHMDSDCEVIMLTWDGRDFDQGALAMGNMFRTKEEAEAKIEYHKAITVVTNAIKKLNGDWVPDWSRGEEKKWYSYFDCNSRKWNTNWAQSAHRLMPYPYCKSEEVSLQIIKDHEKELNIIRDYKF